MANASNLESTIGNWYKAANLPHLPVVGRQWLADNIWWLAIVGAVLSVCGLFVIVPLFFAAIAVTSIASTMTLGYSVVASAYSGLFWLSTLISIVSYVVTMVLLIMSVSPLKAKAKRGWQLLFWSYLFNFAMAVVSSLIAINLFGVVTAVIGAAIAGYFLFEVHEYFGVKHKNAKVTAAKASAKSK